MSLIRLANSRPVGATQVKPCLKNRNEAGCGDTCNFSTRKAEAGVGESLLVQD